MVVISTRTILLNGLLLTIVLACTTNPDPGIISDLTDLERQLKRLVDDALSHDTYRIVEGVSIRRANASDKLNANESKCVQGRKVTNFEDYVRNEVDNYARTHVIAFSVPETARFFKFATGKSSFLTGFGLGFLAFGLKKLLLPLFIGAQIFKSVLIAMFLPSILGSVGKLVSKGLSQASSFSGSSGQHQQQQQAIEDFDFKDTGAPYNAEGTQDQYDAVPAGGDFNFPAATTTSATNGQPANSRFGNSYYQKVSYIHPPSDNYYFRRPTKQHDYKVFHKIPDSSLLLTTYDPFYSPLLSRLDSVFQQLGLKDGKSPQVESCRERLVCLMYANPGKYAPYSNLVSAQLSRELNELRKPSTDNPEILRFFRYMRAAKDGQDGDACTTHSECPTLEANKPSPAMLTVYNDINKLVQARRIN